MHSEGVDAAIKQGSRLIQTILSSSPSDFPEIVSLIRAGAPLWFQEDEGGVSALHAACFVENPQIVRELIKNGAVWNCVDALGNTAADVALSLNDEESYRIIRDEGLRSVRTQPQPIDQGCGRGSRLPHAILCVHPLQKFPSDLHGLLISPKSTEYLLQVLSSRTESPLDVISHSDSGTFGSPEEFLNSNLVFSRDIHGQEVCSVKSGDRTIGVMMGWERGIMQATVKELCATHPGRPSGLRILNIGFGLGIIDTLFQSLDPPPSRHMIVEAHADVLAHMRSNGWYDKKGVNVLEGKWQDFTDTGEIFGEGGWDVIYIDTFAEGYAELKRFFDIVPDLLKGPEARFSFFNGLGATNALFYDVYTQLAELHLKDVGIAVQWSDVDVGDDILEERWNGTMEYFKARLYRLPVGQMIQL